MYIIQRLNKKKWEKNNELAYRYSLEHDHIWNYKHWVYTGSIFYSLKCTKGFIISLKMVIFSNHFFFPFKNRNENVTTFPQKTTFLYSNLSRLTPTIVDLFKRYILIKITISDVSKHTVHLTISMTLSDDKKNIKT